MAAEIASGSKARVVLVGRGAARPVRVELAGTAHGEEPREAFTTGGSGVGAVELATAPTQLNPATTTTPIDAVLFTTKHFDLHAAAHSVREAGLRPRLLVSLANGFTGKAELVKAGWDPHVCVGGLTYMGAQQLSPTLIRKTGWGDTLLERDEGGVADLVASCAPPWFRVVPSSHVETAVWTKLLANCVINPITALLDVPNGDIASLENRDVVAATVDEFMRVSEAVGRRVDFGTHATALDFVLSVARRTAANESSMRADVRLGKRTEADAILGAVVREARRVKQPTPLLSLMWAAIEARGRLSLRSAV